MPRYLRVLKLFWSASLAAELEYRANFLVATLVSLGAVGTGVFGLSLFFRQTDAINGWTWRQALLVFGVYTVFEGLSSALLAPNLSRIVQHVQQGTLDFVLLKPIDSQFWLSSRNFSLWGLPDVVCGVVLIGLGAAAAGVHNRPWHLLLALLPLVCAALILYSIWFLIAATSVWYVKVWNATEVLRSYLEAGRYPVYFYPTAFRVVFRFVIPVAFLTTVPAEVMRGQISLPWLAGAAGLGAGLFISARAFWRYALRHYTSASS